MYVDVFTTFYTEIMHSVCFFFFFSSRRRHTRFDCDWSSDVCSSDLETIAKEIYGAGDVAFAPPAARALEQLPAMGLGETPVCMAKTQYSFSDDPTKLGAPSGFTLQVRDILPAAGAGFVVALAGDIMTMPGLSKTPAAEKIRVHPDGTIEGLF